MKHKVMGKIIMVFALLLIGGYASGQNIRGNKVWSHTTITADTSYVPTGNEKTGDAYYDSENRTISVALGNGVVMQINQEALIQVHNGSGATIMNGRILGAIGGENDRVSVSYADKANRYDALIISTEIIEADSIGLACEIAGRVNGVNTGTVPVGKIFLDTLGLITADPGEFPDYNYPVGSVVKTGVTDGIIQFRSDGANFRNDVRNAFDGAVRETFDFRTFSDGVNVYGVLTNQDAPYSTLTLMFSDDWHDFAVPDTIVLTPGTATNPQQSWVYIDKETRTLQSSTSGFPSTEHAEIAKITLLSAARTQADGALRNQNTNNHLKYANNNGHIVHMGDRIRVLNAQWEDGVALTVSGTPTNLYLATTSGHVWQMHKQVFEAHDMAAGDDIHIVNDFTTPYRTTTNLNTITTYSDGSTWNNEWQNLVLWGVGNKTGEVSHIMLNLSSDGYLSESSAIEDANNYASYVIPRAFRGVGFLIARITVRRSPAGYTFNPSTGYLDLRGYYPNNTAGGGTGSSGLTEFTQLDDTPSSYVGQAFKFLRVNSGETAIEFVGGDQILLTGFDTTGFKIDTSQITGYQSGGGGSQDLQSVTDEGATTTNVITVNHADTITDKAIHNIFISDSDGVLFRHQTYYWNDSSYSTTTGYGFGERSLHSNTGSLSNGFGGDALRNNTGAFSNGFGNSALTNNTGISSSGFGNNSLQSNTGFFSNGFGLNSLKYNTGGNSNGFGNDALSSNIGSNSNGFGGNSLKLNNGTNSNGFGYQSLYSNAGSNSNGFGNYVLYYNSGDYCNAFGYYALRFNEGNYNTAIGHNAGYDASSITYSNVTLLGANTLPTQSNQVVLGDDNVEDVLTKGNLSMGEVIKLTPRSTAPSSPSLGWIYVNSTDNHLYFYNGSTWVQLD